MKNILTLLVILTISFIPTYLFAHGEEDHGEGYHVEVAHIMENGFHGKLDEKVIEVVLAPDVEIEKDQKKITISDLVVGDLVMVQGAQMPGNKIGASKITVDYSSANKIAEKHEMPSMKKHTSKEESHTVHNGH